MWSGINGEPESPTSTPKKFDMYVERFGQHEEWNQLHEQSEWVISGASSRLMLVCIALLNDAFWGCCTYHASLGVSTTLGHICPCACQANREKCQLLPGYGSGQPFGGASVGHLLGRGSFSWVKSDIFFCRTPHHVTPCSKTANALE